MAIRRPAHVVAIQLHMGILFGIVTEIAFALLAVGILALTIYGYLMWWRRIRSRGKASVKRPAPTPMQLGVAAILCVAYSFVAPLFGVSLVIMIIVAAVWSLIEGKRDRQTQAS